MKDLKKLYQRVVLDHNKNPRNFGPMENFTHRESQDNPLCGDQITVYLKIEDEKILDIRFEGQGCALSQASASLMTEDLKGRDVDCAQRRTTRFLEVISQGNMDIEEFGDLAAFSGVHEFSSRLRCVILAWNSFSIALKDH